MLVTTFHKVLIVYSFEIISLLSLNICRPKVKVKVVITCYLNPAGIPYAKFQSSLSSGGHGHRLKSLNSSALALMSASGLFTFDFILQRWSVP